MSDVLHLNSAQTLLPRQPRTSASSVPERLVLAMPVRPSIGEVLVSCMYIMLWYILTAFISQLHT